MKNVLRKFFSGYTAIVKQIVSSREEREIKQLVQVGDKLFKAIVFRLNGNEVQPIWNRHRRSLLHRRLKQYQRMRKHGSLHEKAASLKALEKEWRKFQRDYRIISISEEHKK
jgi:hypothetical protein